MLHVGVLDVSFRFELLKMSQKLPKFDNYIVFTLIMDNYSISAKLVNFEYKVQFSIFSYLIEYIIGNTFHFIVYDVEKPLTNDLC